MTDIEEAIALLTAKIEKFKAEAEYLNISDDDWDDDEYWPDLQNERGILEGLGQALDLLHQIA